MIQKKDRDVEAEVQDQILVMQKLEEAMCLCKFGKFHWRLLSASLAACFANFIVTANTSYLLPAAECDLDMNINQKGLLNAAPFIGMLLFGAFTAFLTDAFGRKRFLVLGYFGMSLCCFIQGSSQNYITLVVGKFLEGCFLSVGFSANIAIVSEFSHKHIRDRVMLLLSSFKCMASLFIVLLTWAMLVHKWHFVIFEDIFELHTWSIYLYVCGIWGLLASLQYYLLPESPKFLLTHGNTKEALNILKFMYSENTGNPTDDFPIKSLTGENAPCAKSAEKLSLNKQTMKALSDMKRLVQRPLLFHLMTFSVMNFMVMFAYNTLRLWFPQISTILETYTTEHKKSELFCVMMDDYIKNITDSENMSSQAADMYETCVPHLPGTETYINGLVMGFVCLLSHGVSGLFLERLGRRTLISIFLMTCSISSVLLNWSFNTVQVTIILSLIVGLTQATLSLLGTTIVRVFPTTVRTMALSIMMIVGRLGSMAGNFIFPFMLQKGCMVPFFTVAVLCFFVAISAFLLPNIKKQNKGTGEN